MQKIHLIAIGGSAMHNLALALHSKGYQVTGSDDEINEPSYSRLYAKGLLPATMGWDSNNIQSDIDIVILGMHARADNPELLKAQELGLTIYSYPAFLYEQSKNKTRIVIGGSHGKTSITSMILHVLKQLHYDFDYLVGASIEGFDTMVKLSDAPIIVIEGDEYLASPIQRVPKFHLYMPHIAVISGIAWDHINVFPTWENYVEQFDIFIHTLQADSRLFYCKEDVALDNLAEKNTNTIEKTPYTTYPHYIDENGQTYLLDKNQQATPILVFGKHNLQNIQAAQLVTSELGVKEEDFIQAIASFKGAAKRLELVYKNESTVIYKDFAHSPSKLKATITAAKEQFTNKKIIACMELHTFSSLNATFLQQYNDCMNEADIALVYFNPHTIAHKKLTAITTEQVKEAFHKENLFVTNSLQETLDFLTQQDYTNTCLLMMSSGNFDGLQFEELPILLHL